MDLTIWPGTQSLTPDALASAKLNLSPLAALNAPNVYVQVVGTDGQIIARSNSLQEDDLPVEPLSFSSALQGKRAFGQVKLEADHSARILNVPITLGGRVLGVMQVGQSLRPLDETMAGLSNLLQMFGVAALAISGFAGWLVGQRGLRTLEAIAGRAAEITAQRDFKQRLGIHVARDEVGQLAEAVDELLATVDETLQTHRSFVADASHALRNPLLAIRTNLDLLVRLDDEEERAECVREARQQVERMSHLVRDLLLMARIEAALVINQRRVALHEVVEGVYREARLRAEEREVRLDGVEPVELLGDEARLTELLSNLVDNAFNYTGRGGVIKMGLEREGAWARLVVEDDGEGIPAEHLPHVFERFYRGAKDRQTDGGTGLGLAIVKYLAEAHGGRVSVESELGKGTRFIVRLPLHQRWPVLVSSRPSPRSAPAPPPVADY
jgi:signal transduction histidine kinase